MALFGRKKTTVGLDIGSGLIKVAVIDHSKREPELVRVAVTPLLADAIVEGEVMDPGIVADAIQAALASAGVKTKDVVTAVGGRDVIIKKISIERVKEQQARELMRWEAEQHVPFDMESVELDFQILDPDGDGVEMSVLLVAAKRELIESKMRVLTDAGLRAGDRRRRRLRAAQRVRGQPSRRDERRRRPAQHRPRRHQHQHSRRRRSDPHARHHGRHAPLPRRPAARARPLGRRGAAAHSGLRSLAAPRRGDRKPRRRDRRRRRARGRVPRAELARRRRCARSTPAAAARAFRGSTTCSPQRLRLPVQQANPLANLKVRDGALESLVTDEIAPLLMLPIGLALRQVA